MTFDDLPPGVLLSDPPLLTLAQLRGYALALLMHTGRLVEYELEATVVAHCNIDDLKVGGVDPFTGQNYQGTRLESLIERLIEEFAAQGLTEWDCQQRIWKVSPGKLGRHLRFCIAMNCELPPALRKYIQEGEAGDAET